MAVPIGMTGVETFLSGAYHWGGDSQSASRILGYEAPLTQNPNDLALILNLILPLTLALVFIARGATIRAALLLAVGLEASAVIMTFSRAGFLSLATIVGSYLWIIRRRPERAWAYAGLVVAVSAFFSPVAYHFHFYYFAGLAVAVKAVDAAAARAPRPAEAR